LVAYAHFLNNQNILIAQYRNKKRGSTVKEDLKLLKRHYKGTLIINDYIDLIEFADGLHLGQEDLLKFNVDKKRALKEIKEKIGSKPIGLSTHNVKEVEEANTFAELDYIGLGAYRQSFTKNDTTIGGKELLKVAQKSKHKVAIIGGVRLDDDFHATPAIHYKVIGSNLMQAFLKHL